MTLLKFLMLLALVVWIGGIIFFAAVLAPAAFAVLPTHQLAGNLVNRTLAVLHIMGMICGVAYLVCSMVHLRLAKGSAQFLSVPHLLVIAMFLLTLVGHFGIARRMHVMHQQMGVIDELAQDDPRRVYFNRLHAWSTQVEGVVLLFGLGALWGTARRLS